MPLRPPPDPLKVLEPLRRALHAARSHPRLGPASLKGVEAEDLRLLPPHPVYDLSRDDLASGKGLEAARLSGFRCLVAQSGAGEARAGSPVDRLLGTLAAAEIRASADGAPVADSWHVNEGPFVKATEAAMQLLETLAEADLDGLEVRLLRVPALHVVALWLASPERVRDRVIVLPPAPAGLPTLTLGPATELAAWLARSAERQRARKDSPWP